MLIPWPKTSLATVAIPGLLYASHPLITEPVFHCSMLIVCCPSLDHRTSFSLFQAHCMLLIPWSQNQFFHCSTLIAWCSLHVPRMKHHCHHSMITELICHLHIVPGYYDLLLHAGGLLLLEAPQVDSPQESKDRFQELKMDWHSSQPSLVFTSGGGPFHYHDTNICILQKVGGSSDSSGSVCVVSAQQTKTFCTPAKGIPWEQQTGKDSGKLVSA